MTTRFTDDFSSGTWATNWNTSITGTSIVQDVVAGEGHVSTPNGSARIALAYDKATPSANQEILVKIRDDLASRNTRYQIGVAMSGITTSMAGATNGVYVNVLGTAAGTYSVQHIVGGVITGASQSLGTLPATAVTRWWRVRHENGIVSIKYWLDGASEPGTWNHTVDTSSFGTLPAGVSALAVETTSSTTATENYYFDSVTSTDANTVLNGGYTAEAATASALIVGPAVTATTVINKTVSQGGPATATAAAVQPAVATTKTVTINATPVTASALIVDPVLTNNLKKNTFTEDASVFDDTPNTVFNSNVARVQNDGNGDDWYLFKLANPQPAETLISVKVKLTGALASTGTFTPEIHRITGTWSESTVTYNTSPAMTDAELTLAAMTTAAGVVNTLDLTSVFSLGYTNGIAIKSATVGAGYWYTKDDATNKPVVEWTYAIGNTPVTVAVDPATGSATVVNPVVSTAQSVTISATAVTASALALNPTLFVEKDTNIAVDVAYATAEAGTNNGFLRQANVAVEPATATAEVLGAAVSTERGPRIAVAPATATISFMQPETVNGVPIVASETDDAYFQRIMARTPYKYLRLAEPNGVTTAADRMGGLGAIYHGVKTGRFDAPDSRPSVYFDGASFIEQNEGNGPNDEAGVTGTVAGINKNSLFEFSFRTTKSRQFILSQVDGGSSTVNELWMVDGKLVYRNLPADSRFTGPLREMTSRSRLDDGKWHTVVIRGFVKAGEGGTEIWVDGGFDVRRYGISELSGFPDFFGARYENYDNARETLLPANEYFVGDMSEISMFSFASNTSLRSDEISRDYYAFQGWAPIAVEPAVATAVAGDAKAKGNQKKALYLYWDQKQEVLKSGEFRQSPQDSVDFDPMPQFITPGMSAESVGEYHGFKVFSRPVYAGPYNKYLGYRDQWTDEPRLIDLEQDIDLDEFDVIMFHDWPDEGGLTANQIEKDFVEINFPTQKDRLLGQLLDANDRGVGLYVTNPTLAVELGIVNRVDWALPLGEGMYDYGSAYKFPWNITDTDGVQSGNPIGTGVAADRSPAFLNAKANYYFDNNRNNRFRVRALVENLTDIPSYMVEEVVYHKDGSQWGNDGMAYKYLHRLNGLQIGDEYVFNGTQELVPSGDGELSARYNRWAGTFATPVANVVAGTVVTTFGETQWKGSAIVPNPYKDYATTIAVQPGDVLANGRVVNGKIFVNFSEAPSYGLGVNVQVTPWSNEALTDPDFVGVKKPNGWPEETAEQKAWEFSFTRTSAVHIDIQPTNQTTYKVITGVGSNGTPTYAATNKARAGLSFDRTLEIYPIVNWPRWEMDGRGMFWLSVEVEDEPGSKTIRVPAATATATTVEPVVTAEHPVTINVEAAIANATLVKPDEDQSGDVIIPVLPATAFAEITGKSVTVSVPPATATAEFVDNFDMVHAQGDTVVLTLHGYDATLFIKEEA